MTLVWRPGNNAITDPDALIYIDKVEKADGQNLEYDVAKAINDFVVGCKTDGIWSAIKASCILAGARTTNGALISLVGTAPTPNNFDLVGDTDYDRKTGLKGDGSTKYLNTNRSVSADPQDNAHIAAYSTAKGTINQATIIGTVRGRTRILTFNAASDLIMNVATAGNTVITGANTPGTGFLGVSRSGAALTTARFNSSNLTSTTASQARGSVNHGVFYDPNLSDGFSNGRLAFYSIGESLDLAKLDTRVSALITAIGAAIP
jgi:hypothetical protein